jgi:hypothetical protein
MNKFLIVAGVLVLGLAAFYFTGNDRRVRPDESTTPTLTPTTIPEEEMIVWDMYVEEVGERVGFQNARLLLVNEGHVVQNIYITDETSITGADISIDTLEKLEVGTPVRIIGSPTEGGVLANELIINPINHYPTPQLP